MTTADTKQSSALRVEIQQILSAQQQPTITILSSLLAVQDSIHYLPEEAIKETARFTGETTNEVWSVASFYTNFRFTPPGEKTLDVCWGPSCHLLGAQSILESVHSALEVTEESAQGPCIAIDHRVFGKQTPQTATKIALDLRGLKS